MELCCVACVAGILFVSALMAMMPRSLFIAMLEILNAVFGVLYSFFPQVTLQAVWPWVAAMYSPTDYYLLSTLGVLTFLRSMISFLTRRQSNDEYLLWSVAGYWFVTQLVQSVPLWGLALEVPEMRAAANGTNANLPSDSTLMMTVAPSIILVLAFVGIMFRWPSFRVQISMTSGTRFSKHLILFQLIIMGFAMQYILFPHSVFMAPMKATDASIKLCYIIGINNLLSLVHLHVVENFYSDDLKKPACLVPAVVMPIMGTMVLAKAHFMDGIVSQTYLIAALAITYVLAALNGSAYYSLNRRCCHDKVA